MTAFIPQYEREEVLVGLARGFVAEYNALTPVELPDEEVALGAAWSPPWTPLGATEEGLAFLFSRETEGIFIEEQATPVHKNTTEANLAVEAVLSQDSLKTWKLAMGGGLITVVAAGVGQIGKRTLKLSTDLEQLVMAFEGKNAEGYWRRVLIPIVTSEGKVEARYRRAADARRYATTFNALCAIEDVIIEEMTAPATV